MDAVLLLINEYDEKKFLLLQDYRNLATNKFGSDLDIHIYEAYNRIINIDKYHVERYIRLFNYYSNCINDIIVKEMIFEKLQNEYNIILGIQKDIILHLKFYNSEDMSIVTLLVSFEKLASFMYINKFKKQPVYKALLRIQEVHKIHGEIFMNSRENCKHDNYDKELFKLTDVEIIARNEEILQKSKSNKTQLDIEYNTIEL
jgi:hypothetical protein